MNAYLIGPTRGYPANNVRGFREAAASLESDFPVVTFANPDQHDMRVQVLNMLQHDVVVALPGWELDPTSKFLGQIAVRCEIAVVSYPDLEPVTPVG